MSRLGTDGEIAEWLDSLGLSEYAPVFRAHAVRGDVLHLLSKEDLEEIGVDSIGHRARILKAISRLPPLTPRPILSLEFPHPPTPFGSVGSAASPAESSYPTPTNGTTVATTKDLRKLLARVESLEKQNRKLLVKYKEDQPLPTPTFEPELSEVIPSGDSLARRIGKRFISDSKSSDDRHPTLSGRVIQPVRVPEGGTTPEVLAAAFREQNLSGNPQEYQLFLVWDSDANNDYRQSYKLQPHERPQEVAKVLAGGRDDLRFVLVRKGKTKDV